jgi:phospholipid/cholesterol/gamma-HCH transport system ATP-binding protein
MIEITNLSLWLNKRPILSDISLNISDTAKTVIIGKSGCGKTMLMKTLIGLYIPHSGTVCIDGVLANPDIAAGHKKPQAPKLAMLFQNAALLDSFTVFQNVALPLFEHSDLPPEQIHAKVDAVLRFLGLEKTAENHPAELSGGMRKRVGLARAIIVDPKYLILDEPTTGLDPITATEVMSFLQLAIKQKQLVPITITHDPYCINELGDNMILMDQGKVIYNGTKSELEKLNTNPIAEFYQSFFNINP